MRIIGLILVAVGIIGAAYAMNFNTSIRVGGSLVHNFELSDKQLLIGLFSGAVFISGTVLFGLGEIIRAFVAVNSTAGGTGASSSVPFYYRYDPQLLGMIGLIALTVCGAVVWVFAGQS